jgi:uncharacterized protein YecE (DUF72 family)
MQLIMMPMRIEKSAAPLQNKFMAKTPHGKNFRIGCQSWGYEDWITQPGGDYVFYPPATKKSEMLSFYSKVFDTIEIDATLYGIPAASTFEKWYDETPGGFKFGLKTPREVTHDGRLSAATVPVMLEFVERSQLLKEKLGVFLIQLPPSFDGSRENGQNLREFLTALPLGFEYAVEFRNQDWFIDWTFEELEKNAITLGLVEGPWLPREYMFEAVPKLTADFAYIRIMGERDLEKFDRIYRHRDETLERWTNSIRELNATNIYIYVDNYFEGFAPETANKLRHLLGLPVSNASEFQEQRSLF